MRTVREGVLVGFICYRGWRRSGGGDLTKVGDADNEVRDDECGWTVKAVVTFFHVRGSVLKKGGDIRNCHERHECSTEELDGDQ